MGGGPVLACLAAVVMTVTSTGSGTGDHWSRPATPERRQGDWVPLSCATPNCRPLDQGSQSTNSLPSVLTPPPRLEEARLLPPPPPPDGLFQTAASGFLQAFTQQQPPRKPLQFLQETTVQSNNRPQAQFLSSQGPVGKQQQFLQEPSADFTPPQETRQQQQLVPFNQQPFLPDQPYLNQPLFIGPQFLAAPFFPQTNIPPQNIQTISPVQVQPQAPITPNQNFQVPADRPVFLQQITAGAPQESQSPSQQRPQGLSPQQQYSINDTGNQAIDEDKDEVQLLYVPVETLNRARNLGRPKSIAQGTSHQVVATTEPNTFTSPTENFEFSTVSHTLEEQASFNAQTQASKHQYNTKQNAQFQQQLPPEDQEKFNTQTYTVAQQFNIKPLNEQFQQAPLEGTANFKTKPTKQQYNFKLNDQYQQQFPQDQANFQQSGQFQSLPELDNQQKGVSALEQNPHQQNFREQNLPQQDQAQFNAQRVNQQFTTQQSAGAFQQVVPVHQHRFQEQPIPVEQHGFQQQAVSAEQQRFQQQAIPVEQQRFQKQGIPVEQKRFQQQAVPLEQQRFQQQTVPLEQQSFQQQTVPLGQQSFQGQDVREAQSQLGQRELSNHQTSATQQYQINQQTFDAAGTLKDQPYINQPIQFNQQVSNEEQVQTQKLSSQQTHPQQQFDQLEVNQQTAAPVTQTRLPEAYSSQQTKKQRFMNSQDSVTNVQQQNNQFTRKFPKDYRQPAPVDTSAQLIDPLEQAYNLRQQQEQAWTQNQNLFSQQDIPDIKHANKFQSDHQRGSSVAPTSSTQPPPPPTQTTLAPNQPPLSVYMETTEDTKVNDVLRLLKNAKTIQVLDTVGPESPQVFVGPSNLKAPTGYIKFELPYLNAIENNNRVERKVDKLPFFVAPLNFNPPPGYSKIPFPAPHIGSVVVSNATVLKTALHEKPYEDQQKGVSTTERFKDQYTLPAEISPISPQLPSLINSLQDEIYSGSSTTNFPTTTPDVTTPTYTTPAYRGRGSSRGSYRGAVTSGSPSRRPQSRTRRPYDGQPYSRRRTTTTTTPEPSTEASVQQFTSQPEQLAFNADAYNVQNTASSLQGQAIDNQQHFQQENAAAYHNEQFLANNYKQFPPQPQQSNAVDHITQAGGVESIEGLKQYHQTEDSTQHFARDTVAQTTTVPALTRPEVHQEDQTFTSQRTAGTRRDPARQHQRFRGRQRLTTTTTEQYETPIQQEPQFNLQQVNQFNQQSGSRINYQNPPRRVQLDNHRLVENTHFTASLPSNKFNIQTERADAAFQTTERQFIAQGEEQLTHANENKDSQHEFQFNPESQVSNNNAERALQLQYQQEQPQGNVNFNLGQTTDNQKTQGQFEYVPEIQQSTTSPANQFQQENTQREVYDQNNNPQQQANFHQVNTDHIDQVGNDQAQQNYFKQQNKQTQELHPIAQQEQVNAQRVYNDGQLFQYTQEQERESTPNQEQHVTQHDQITELPPQIVPQQRPIQTPQPESVPQAEEEAKVPQYNQQRLVKYNRQQNRAQFDSSTINDEQLSIQQGRGQQNVQGNSQTPDVTTTEATTRASLVRVRGRVRSRQRASTRTHQSTTTEEPNYPTTYLNKQRTNQDRDDNQQDYATRKRVNYNRQSARNAYKEDQNIPDSNFANTEKQPISDRFSESPDVSLSTTEAPTTIKGRRYQHILNRNKIRRTQPTNSPSTAGSSGTTRFLTPSTPQPVTRLPVTRGRIRKPVSTTTTTTEYPQVSPKWNEQDNFAPSAGSNEILEPLYQTKDKTKEQPSYGFLRPPVPPKSVPKEVPPPEDQDDYWNQGVTIQQSTSFDFKADPAAVTPPSFATNEQNEGISSIWNGQVELQDGQFYDVFNQQQQVSKHANDQTPFSSDQQKVVYKEVKNRQPVGKENQYTEKTYDIKGPSVVLEEEETEREKVYPVYREIIKPAESIQDESQSQVSEDSYHVEGKGYEKDSEYSEQSSKGVPRQEEIVAEDGSEVKEGALKRKFSAINAGKKGVRRRGQWVRVRVRKPQDSLETAESQNLAVHSENAIQAVTKAEAEKVSWTPDLSTTTKELPQTTSEIPTVSEPAETINFEEALKDMLKEFITNPDENKEEEGTELSTIIPEDVTNTSSTTEEVKSDEPYQMSKEQEKQIPQEEVRIEQDEERQNSEKQEYIGKTLIPEATTETLAQELTTIFQTIENAETTIEPEVTTNLNEQAYNSQHSRVLGTSTTTEISLETEICYRGRCVKTKKLDGGSDLLTME